MLLQRVTVYSVLDVQKQFSVPSFEALMCVCCMKVSHDLTAKLVENHLPEIPQSDRVTQIGNLSQQTAHFN
jgi:hypothetical protein